MERRRKEEELELLLRITLVEPPGGVEFCLQGRNNELVGQTRATGKELSFDLNIRAVYAGKAPRFLGPFTHGPPVLRFLYVCSGTCAGEKDSCWTRRAKVPLSGITGELIARVRSAGSAKLEARIKNTAKDGGPPCATVGLLGDGWQVIHA